MSGPQRFRRTRSLFRAILLAVPAACASVRPPPCSAESAWGVARASTPEAAERLSAHLRYLAPRIVARVPGLATKPLDARFVESLYLPGVESELRFKVTGATIHTARSSWVELRESDRRVDERRILAHELVHYWIGPDWDPLPLFLEEGLADNVQDSVVPQGYARESLDRVVTLASVLFSGLVFDAQGTALRCMSSMDDIRPGETGEGLMFTFARPDFQAVRKTLTIPQGSIGAMRDPQKYCALLCTGYLLVARIGVERLHRLCLRAKASGLGILPPEWVLEAAGLPAQASEEWSRAILELYGPVEQKERRRRESLHESQANAGLALQVSEL